MRREGREEDVSLRSRRGWAPTRMVVRFVDVRLWWKRVEKFVNVATQRLMHGDGGTSRRTRRRTVGHRDSSVRARSPNLQERACHLLVENARLARGSSPRSQLEYCEPALTRWIATSVILPPSPGQVTLQARREPGPLRHRARTSALRERSICRRQTGVP